MEPTRMELTPRQIKNIDEIRVDKAAVDSTLEVALQFHSNLINKLTRDEEAWWQEMAEYHKFSRDTGWRIKRGDGVVCIVPIEL